MDSVNCATSAPGPLANRPLREQLLRWIGHEELGKERFFPSASAAVDDFLATYPTRR